MDKNVSCGIKPQEPRQAPGFAVCCKTKDMFWKTQKPNLNFELVRYRSGPDSRMKDWENNKRDEETNSLAGRGVIHDECSFASSFKQCDTT
jgi:hypothetical protein